MTPAVIENVSLLKDEDGKTKPQSPSSSTSSVRVEREELQPSCYFLLFRLHSLLSVLSLTAMAFAQALPKAHDVPYFIMRLEQCYILLACSIGIVAEMEISDWLTEKIAPILKNLLIRGGFYLFLAIVASEESTETTGKEGHLTSLILQIAGIGFLISGSIYMLMGLCCLKGLRDRTEKENQERLRKLLRSPSTHEDV